MRARSLAVLLGVIAVAGGLAAGDEPQPSPSPQSEVVRPGDRVCLAELTTAYEALDGGDLERAAAHYRLAVEAAESASFRFQALFGLGSTYGAMGRHEEAVEPLELAVAARSDHAEGHYLLGTVYAKLGRTDEAVVSFERAVELAPGLTRAHLDLSLLYARLGWHRQAEEECRRVLEIEPENVEARLGLAVALFHLEEHEAAVVAFQRALEVAPTGSRARTRYGLGLALLYSGDTEGAVAQYLALKEEDPALARDLYVRISQ